MLLNFSSLLFKWSHLQALYQNDKEQLKPFETTPMPTELQERSSRPSVLAQFRESKNIPSCLKRKMATQAVTIGAQQLHAVLNPVLSTNDFQFLLATTPFHWNAKCKSENRRTRLVKCGEGWGSWGRKQILPILPPTPQQPQRNLCGTVWNHHKGGTSTQLTYWMCLSIQALGLMECFL